MAIIEGPIGRARIPEAIPIEQKRRMLERLANLSLNIVPRGCSEEVRILRTHLQRGWWSPEKEEAVMQSIVGLVKKGGTLLHTDLLEKLKKGSLKEAAAIIEQQTPPLGRYGLIRGRPLDQPIKEVHEEWFLERALILEILQQTREETDEAARSSLEEATLRRCTRGANPIEKETVVTQNPLTRGMLYHRETYGTLLSGVETRFASALLVPKESVMAIDSPRFVEMLHRIPFNSQKVVEVKTVDELKDLVIQGLQKTLDANSPEQVGAERIDDVFYTLPLIDCSKLFADVRTPEEMQQRSSEIRVALLKRAKRWIEDSPDKEAIYYVFKKVAQTLHGIELSPENLITGCCPISSLIVAKFYGQSLLLSPGITRDWSTNSVKIRRAIFHAGFNPPANDLYRPLLELSGGYEALAKKEGLPFPSLDTSGYKIHSEFTSFEEFLRRSTVADFRALSHEGAVPYQKVLAATTVDLLRGLSEEYVDRRLAEKGLSPLLEGSLFRVHNAMREAIFRKESMIDFLQQLDIIHEEIELLLSVANPYPDDEFAAVVSKSLTEGADPVIPKDYGRPCVSLKTSGMRAIYSALASAMAQKNGHSLQAAGLKDNYYETDYLTDPAKNAMCSSYDVVDGDFFRTNPDATFDLIHSPIDVFVCEFHHNIQEQRRFYRTEDIQGMLLRMYERGLAHSCTVIIDTTIDLDQSEDIRSLLKNETMKRLVGEGKLNIVLARSGQKFDMLGFDNYSGGIVTAINNGEAFRVFNERLLADDDQMRGINRQGLTHLMKYGGDGLDQYRRALINNTRKLYDALPQEMVSYEGSAFPVQISDVRDDPMAVFLDIKSPSPQWVLPSLINRFFRMTYDESLPVTSRPSFGFATTNIVGIGNSRRISPGLDDENHLMRYAEFFREVYRVTDMALKETKGQSEHDVAKKIMQAFMEMEIPGYTPPPRSCVVWSVGDLDKAKKDLWVDSPTSIKELNSIINSTLCGWSPSSLIDVSGLCPEPLNPDDLEKVLRLFEYKLIEAINELSSDQQYVAFRFIIILQVVAGTTFQGKNYLIAPEFFVRQSVKDSKAVKAVKEARATTPSSSFSSIESLFGEGDVYDRDEIKDYLQQVRPA